MSLPSGVEISDECIAVFRDLLFKRGPNKPAFVIYRISDDKESVIVEDSSSEKDYELFLQRLISAIDIEGKQAPRYAVYDLEYDLNEDGRRSTTVFITWVPEETSIKSRMLYAATKEQLRRALDVKVSIHADKPSDIEYKIIVEKASGGRVQI